MGDGLQRKRDSSPSLSSFVEQLFVFCVDCFIPDHLKEEVPQ